MGKGHSFALGPDSPHTSPNRGEDTGSFSNLKQGWRAESQGTDSHPALQDKLTTKAGRGQNSSYLLAS